MRLSINIVFIKKKLFLSNSELYNFLKQIGNKLVKSFNKHFAFSFLLYVKKFKNKRINMV